MQPGRLLLLIFLLACAAPAYAGKTRHPKPDAAKIDTLAYLPPFARIAFWDDDTFPDDDSVSSVAGRLLGNAIDSFRQQMRGGPEIAVPEAMYRRTKDAVFDLFDQARKRPMKYHDLKIPPVLDSLLKASGRKFVLLTGIRGMTRSRQDLRRANAQSAMIQVASMNTVGMRVVKTTCLLDAIIIDVERQYLYYNKFTQQEEVNPTNRHVVARKFKSLFDRFFWPGSANAPL